MLQAVIRPYTLNFAFRANTSRESLTEKKTFFVEINDKNFPEKKGTGEIAFFPSLQPSFVSLNGFVNEVKKTAENINDYVKHDDWPKNSAIRFGFESALLDMEEKTVDSFSKQNNDGIRINGLVWMNDYVTMRNQIAEKIGSGFRCIKLKIGSLDFKKEIELISDIRKDFTSKEIEIRVDANGAFNYKEAREKLEKLSKFDIHSIEQPLPRDSKYMPEVCKNSPVPVALDEDMIERWWTDEQMYEWLYKTRPSFVVIKPSLVGGFKIADRWVRIAKSLDIGWWATSALESNIGLKAIAKWLMKYPESMEMPQGLGTGQIYTNNVDCGIELRGERLFLKK